MGIQSLLHIKSAISRLNPEEVRRLADLPLRIAVVAHSTGSFETVSNFLLARLAFDRRGESAATLFHQPVEVPGYDVTIYADALNAPRGAIVYRPSMPDKMIGEVLDRHEQLGISLARAFPPFRRCFVDRVIAKTCKENTLFSLTTALPDIVPSIIELPWAVAEFASDTAFLTMNQMRMAFVIAAASDREVGYREQKSEVATVVASAFGWRAIARQVVGKIPFGGGLIGKAAVAYAGTRVLGLSLDHLYSIGYAYTREQRDTLYADAMEQGRTVAKRILTYLRPDLAAKFASKQHPSSLS